MAAMRGRINQGMVLLSLFFSGISCTGRSQAALPAAWARDMQLNIYHGGGMVPESFRVTISDTACAYIHWHQPKTDTFTFSLSPAELNNLLTEMNNRHFTVTVSGATKNIVYDRPTTSIEMNWAGQTHTVSIGATEEIKKGDPADFNRLWGFIIDIALTKTGQGPR